MLNFFDVNRENKREPDAVPSCFIPSEARNMLRKGYEIHKDNILGIGAFRRRDIDGGIRSLRER